MSRFFVLFSIVFGCFFGVACGIQEPDAPTLPSPADASVVPPIDETPSTVDGPFRSPASCIWDFNTRYVSGSSCGEVRGNLTNMGWDSGPRIDNPDGDGWLGMSYTVEDGVYELSYLGFQNCDSESPGEAWAQYGSPEQLLSMTSEDRSFIQCNWWDAGSREVVEVDNPSCSLRVMVSDCNIVGAGNMENFTTAP